MSELVTTAIPAAHAPAAVGSSAAAAAPGTPDKAQQQLKQATQQFESYFLHMMLQEMRKTVPKDTLLGDDADEQQNFQDMIDQKIADAMSKREDLGISKMLYNQLAPTLGEGGAEVIVPNGSSELSVGRSIGEQNRNPAILPAAKIEPTAKVPEAKNR